MGFETFGNKRAAIETDDSYETKIDTLLATIPETLRDEWENRVVEMPPKEAFEMISNLVESRHRARFAKGAGVRAYTAEAPRALSNPMGDLRDLVLQQGVELGAGKVGRVLTHPRNQEICVKVIMDKTQYALCNNIITEGEFLGTLDGFTHAGIRSPRAYYTVALPDFTAIVMERLPGFSMDQLLKMPSLPEGFNRTQYFHSLHQYIDAIATQYSVYHRDLHTPGNLMFDTASGEGYVIDFGRAMRAFPDQDGFIEAKVGDHLIRTRDHGHQEIDGVEALVKARFG